MIRAGPAQADPIRLSARKGPLSGVPPGSLVRVQPGALMFVATALVYPCVLAVLCIGAGLLVDRVSGGFLPAPLLLTVGAAALIAVSQLTTYVSRCGARHAVRDARRRRGRLVAGPRRVRATGAGLARAACCRLPRRRWPTRSRSPRCSLAGRPTFSSFMALSDSAVHMMGADYLIHHGQDYGAPGPAQLLRPVRQRLLQQRLSLRRGHALRRHRASCWACR